MKAASKQEIRLKAATAAAQAPQDKSDAAQDANPLDRLKSRVLQPFEKRVYGPLNRMVDRLGYFSCAVLLVTVTGGGAVAVHWWANPVQARSVFTTARYYLDARTTDLPRDQDTLDVSRDLSNQLSDEIAPSNRRGKDSYTWWTGAQMAVALQGRDAFDPPEMSRWLMSVAGECHCWQDIDGYSHLGTTGWVLLALSRMGIRPTEQQIEFVLDTQHRPGWWPTYPSTDDAHNAATYPTAYCTWALAELLRRDLIADSQKQRAADAVRRGRAWLLDNTIPNKPGRWKDYPNGGYGAESIGVSGLALHVLHRTPGPAPVANDRDWMLNLPSDLPGPRDEVSSGQVVLLSKGSGHSDATHNFTLPWLVVGTVDAYSQGTLVMRARAARLFHQIEGERQAIVECTDMPWLEAEILIALRYLKGEEVI